MNRVRMLSLALAAVLAGSVHAQMCSGGNDGGIDATGNECNWPSEDAALTAGPATSPPAIRLTQVSGQKSTPTAKAVPTSRKVRAAAPPDMPAKSAKTEIGSEAFCSGGASGGMDVNGAECGEASVAEISLVAQHNVR